MLTTRVQVLEWMNEASKSIHDDESMLYVCCYGHKCNETFAFDDLELFAMLTELSNTAYSLHVDIGCEFDCVVDVELTSSDSSERDELQDLLIPAMSFDLVAEQPARFSSMDIKQFPLFYGLLGGEDGVASETSAFGYSQISHRPDRHDGEQRPDSLFDVVVYPRFRHALKSYAGTGCQPKPFDWNKVTMRSLRRHLAVLSQLAIDLTENKANRQLHGGRVEYGYRGLCRDQVLCLRRQAEHVFESPAHMEEVELTLSAGDPSLPVLLPPQVSVVFLRCAEVLRNMCLVVAEMGRFGLRGVAMSENEKAPQAILARYARCLCASGIAHRTISKLLRHPLSITGLQRPSHTLWQLQLFDYERSRFANLQLLDQYSKRFRKTRSKCSKRERPIGDGYAPEHLPNEATLSAMHRCVKLYRRRNRPCVGFINGGRARGCVDDIEAIRSGYDSCQLRIEEHCNDVNDLTSEQRQHAWVWMLMLKNISCKEGLVMPPALLDSVPRRKKYERRR